MLRNCRGINDARWKIESKSIPGNKSFPHKLSPFSSKREFTRDIRSTSVVRRMSRIRPLMCPSTDQVK